MKQDGELLQLYVNYVLLYYVLIDRDTILTFVIVNTANICFICNVEVFRIEINNCN
jgi:hypothetical protein